MATAVCLSLSSCRQESSTYDYDPPPTSPPTPPECAKRNSPEPLSPNRPTIELLGPDVIEQELGQAYEDPGAIAMDPEEGEISDRIVALGLDGLDLEQIGDYMIRYTVQDRDGHPAEEVTRLLRIGEQGRQIAQTARPLQSTSSHLGYFEHLPLRYGRAPGEQFPLLVYNHGVGEAVNFVQSPGDKFATSPNVLDRLLRRGLSGLIHDGAWDQSQPFIVLSPQRCLGVIDAEVDSIRDFLDYALRTYHVDLSRIYMVGFSGGSYVTWEYSRLHPQQLAATVNISGGGSTQAGCVLKQTPAWGFHAANDATVPVNDSINTVLSINGCSPAEPAKLTIFSTGGHLIDLRVLDLSALGEGDPRYDAYDPDIYAWLLAHSRAQ